MFNIDDCLKYAVENNVSDIHIRTGEITFLRMLGVMKRYDDTIITKEIMSTILNSILPSNFKSSYNNYFDLDFSYNLPNCARFRVNMSRNIDGFAITLRTIPLNIPNLKDLSLPSILTKFRKFNNGLILITGPTGSGKTTTLASLLNNINTNDAKHIITIEDPIEFIYNSDKSLVVQRQLTTDVKTFSDGIKYALRQDPDVILVGEIRDRLTLESALRAAETGNLVFSTLHTNSAIQAINRIINIYDPEEREFVLFQLANSLRAIVSQKLALSIDGTRRYPACEILLNTVTVADYIAKNDIDKIYAVMKNSPLGEMATMNGAIYDLIVNNLISQKEGLRISDNKNELSQMLRGVAI